MSEIKRALDEGIDLTDGQEVPYDIYVEYPDPVEPDNDEQEREES